MRSTTWGRISALTTVLPETRLLPSCLLALLLAFRSFGVPSYAVQSLRMTDDPAPDCRLWPCLRDSSRRSMRSSVDTLSGDSYSLSFVARFLPTVTMIAAGTFLTRGVFEGL
ncbi:hypothetical protein GCM10023238_35990 [Streptomyces heliomycini]